MEPNEDMTEGMLYMNGQPFYGLKDITCETELAPDSDADMPRLSLCDPQEVTLTVKPTQIWTKFFKAIYKRYPAHMTRKRFRKLLMSCGWSRDESNVLADAVHACGTAYHDAWIDFHYEIRPGVRIADGPHKEATT